ncbi:hypothetical protein IWQ60_012052, partial [Tieghemiomyces parasiticus]
MSDYITYFLHPQQVVTDFPDLDQWTPTATAEGVAIQARAKRLVLETLATAQFPDFHTRHPSAPGATVPTTPVISPVLSPSVTPLRVPTQAAKLRITRDAATGLPLDCWSATRPSNGRVAGSHTAQLDRSRGVGAAENMAIESTTLTPDESSADEAAPFPASAANLSRPAPDSAAPGASELSGKHRRLLALTALIIDRTKLPLDFLDDNVSIPVLVLLFSYSLASRNGQLV